MAAFAQSNEGDVSPNTEGARCLDTGDECDMVTSTCNGKVGVHRKRSDSSLKAHITTAKGCNYTKDGSN